MLRSFPKLALVRLAFFTFFRACAAGRDAGSGSVVIAEWAQNSIASALSHEKKRREGGIGIKYLIP